ncbi:hypothetical protein A6F49_10090 [Enteractinococcus helveticum]|uniref:Uncharacterized protein n=1 Tax=Enteractinococcus helveticum TaxID=1837282 RepID=A0A1B7LZ85_9MICC|nr:hypothetical protein A6F49_10090 [Enteractinococcus helveticum]
MSVGGASIESSVLQTLSLRTTQPDAPRGKRTRIWAALASLCALVLVACGADVNSQLELEDDFSGSRTFVMTMADADIESLSGGLEAATQVLESHAPEVLSFDGVEQREEGYSATFTLAFNDLEDYENKINSLLEASAIPAAERDMSIELADQPLMTTLSVQESFYNDDLMGWAADALMNEGVVESNATVLTSSGTATVVFNGEEINTSTSLPRINFQLTQDHRFEDVGLDLEFLESGDMRVTMVYSISADSAEIQNEFLTEQIAQLNDLEGLTEPVQDAGPSDPADGSDTIRQVAAQFSTPEAVSAGMQLLLANDEASFEVQEVTADTSPDVITQYLGTNWTCAQICDPNNLQQLDGETTYPEHWQLVEDRRGDGEFFAEFNRGMPLQQMTAVTQLGFDGSMEQTFEFVVDNATVEGHEDTVTDRFSPPPNTGSFHTAVEGDKTVYATTFRAQSAHELTQMINTYLQDKGVETPASIDHGPITGIWASYDLRVDLSPIWEVVTGGVEETTTFRVQLPAMHSGHSGEDESNERTIAIQDSTGTFMIQANGPTITTAWVAALSVVFLIVIVVLLFRTRRAATRVWSVAPARSVEEAKPYHVQGPKDRLTETEIFETPPASGSDQQSTVPTPRPRQTTKSLESPGPFPDVPIPSQTQYQHLQSRLRQKRQEAERASPETDSVEATDEDDPDQSSGNS